MPSLVVIGAQWGDEGKGKIVDHLASMADVVVRFGGGPNAGHTLVVDGKKLIVRLVPSGILWPGKQCVLAQGMVIDPAVLVRELDELTARGHSLDDRLFISDRAHLILPHHVLADGLRENLAAERAIGTTRRGIGPAYEDKIARRGLLVGDLRDMSRAEQILSATLEAWRPLFELHHVEAPSIRAVSKELSSAAARILPFVTDTGCLVSDRISAGKRVLLEGAQGTLLDIDHGTYPFVTSSSTTAGGACTGTGIGPRAISRVLGITKAYATRVGSGPFPTELHDAAGQRLRDVGGEFGSVTGRPRRTGWLDLPALRYAARVNSFDALAITKLDVLTGMDPILVCVAYDTPSGRVRELPVELARDPASLVPVYESLPGWTEDISDARSLGSLPACARDYLSFIESAVGVHCDLVSVGPDRDATIVTHPSF